MAKRNPIQEIQSVKSRAEFNSRYDYKWRFNDIQNALDEFASYQGNYNKELLRYIPIATVACFEAFFRSAVKELVDSGKPFSENVADFNQSRNIKLDFEVIAAIQTRVLTVGEIIAHFLSYNNIEDVNSNIKTLTGEDFLTKLKIFTKNSIHDSVNEEVLNFQNNFSEIIASVKSTYELRHIFCHEFATNVEIDEVEIIKNFKNCGLFLEQSDKVIWNYIHPNSAETQAEMYSQAVDDYQLTEEALHDLIFAIKSGSLEGAGVDFFDEKGFDDCIGKWKEYRVIHAESSAKVFEGGSLAPTIYMSDMAATTREKIDSLNREFEISLKKSKYKPNLNR